MQFHLDGFRAGDPDIFAASDQPVSESAKSGSAKPGPAGQVDVLIVGCGPAGLTLVISLFMHDFWNVYEGGDQDHETQNFIKNLAIMAGLLFVAGTTPAQKAAT